MTEIDLGKVREIDGAKLVNVGRSEEEYSLITKDRSRALEVSMSAIDQFTGYDQDIEAYVYENGGYYYPAVLFRGHVGAVLVDKDGAPTGFRFQGPNDLNPAAHPGESWIVANAKPREVWNIDLTGELFPFQGGPELRLVEKTEKDPK